MDNSDARRLSVTLIEVSPGHEAEFQTISTSFEALLIRKEYGRTPTLYASQGFDTAMLINAAVRDVKGKIEDHDAVRKALKAAKFESVRGAFRFNTNQYPIQNYYVRTVGSDGKGGLINKSFNDPILKDHGDAYVQACAMK